MIGYVLNTLQRIMTQSKWKKSRNSTARFFLASVGVIDLMRRNNAQEYVFIFIIFSINLVEFCNEID